MWAAESGDEDEILDLVPPKKKILKVSKEEYSESSKFLGATLEEEQKILSFGSDLEKLGITKKKTSISDICVNNIVLSEKCNIILYFNHSQTVENIKCSWCHQYPQIGTVMMAVPYNYVPYTEEDYLHAPETLNELNDLTVKPFEPIKKNEKNSLKKQHKLFYIKRSVNKKGKDYFLVSKPVCSFNCMESKGRELSVSDTRYKNYRCYMNILYKIIFEKDPPAVFPRAPHFECLQEYGGKITLEEYRNNFTVVELDNSNQYYSSTRDTAQIFSSTIVN